MKRESIDLGELAVDRCAHRRLSEPYFNDQGNRLTETLPFCMRCYRRTLEQAESSKRAADRARVGGGDRDAELQAKRRNEKQRAKWRRLKERRREGKRI